MNVRAGEHLAKRQGGFPLYAGKSLLALFAVSVCFFADGPKKGVCGEKR